MNIGFASIAEVDLIWPLIVHDIQTACERGEPGLNAGELWQMCRSGNGYLCIVHDERGILSASVWRFEGDAFRCWTLTGKSMRVWLPALHAFIEKIAIENGISRLVTKGRAGWTRVFRNCIQNGNDYEVELWAVKAPPHKAARQARGVRHRTH